jgi:hypothetical protein
VAKPAIPTRPEAEAFVVAVRRVGAPVVELSSGSTVLRPYSESRAVYVGDVRLEVSGQRIHRGVTWAGLVGEAQADLAR